MAGGEMKSINVAASAGVLGWRQLNESVAKIGVAAFGWRIGGWLAA
jgi:hypothetical protein